MKGSETTTSLREDENMRRILWGSVLATAVLALALGTYKNATAQYQTTPSSNAPALNYNPVKKMLREGKVAVGVTITAGNVDVAATMANAGFDFLWIEMEHSPLTLESVRSMILATRGLKAVPITRVPINEPWLAKRVLDIGSLGVIFPFTS